MHARDGCRACRDDLDDAGFIGNTHLDQCLDFAIPHSSYLCRAGLAVAASSGDADRDAALAKAVNPFPEWGNLMGKADVSDGFWGD